MNKIAPICVRGLGKGGWVRKISEYLEHAKECREMALKARADQRQQLENMAATWEQLAENRRKKLEREGLSADGE